MLDRAINATCFSIPFKIGASASDGVTSWKLHHDGSHHFLVLVRKNVAMIDKARVLSQLVGGDVEVVESITIFVI